MEKLTGKLKELQKNGFFAIYLSTIMSKVVTLFGGVLIVRMLSKNDYGIYTLVLNCIGILSICGDLGSTSAMLQLGIENSENDKKQRSYIIYGLKLALISGFITSLLILFSKLYYPYKNNLVSNYATILFLTPVLTIVINYFGVILRIKENNKKYSLFQFLTTLIHYAITISFTLFFGLKGSLLSQYVYNVILIIVGIILTKKIISLKGSKEQLDKTEKKEYLKLSFGSQINNSIFNLLSTIDIFIIGYLNLRMLDITHYKVATVIPNALSFLPQCLMVYLIPYFIKHNSDKKWIKEKTKALIFYGMIGYGIIALIFVLCSKLIISLLYGASYLPSTKIFNMLVFSFFINATLKTPLSNILYTMHKIDINLLISILGIVLNFILNIVFVKLFGAIGAAYATVVVSIFMSILSLYFIMKNTRKN